ncbi:ficolin-2, partial [Plakobranchus ocellatus]
RRAAGDVDFYHDWTSYPEGFGSLTGYFWMGNETLYNISDKDPYELRIDIRINNGQDVFARYSSFRIEDEANKYRLQIGSYSRTAGDYFSYHNNMLFTTFENDKHPTLNCAIRHPGVVVQLLHSCCAEHRVGRHWDEDLRLV